uniref:Uncharacterized protein n=1 Tax=Gossypium raimondii TaxID=29730 RepID=A0A0D2SR75_GOSRA|nr:hypothetical protein B456_010G120100 [Gossypium raimondii]
MAPKDGESISQTPQGVFKPLASYSSMLNQIEELLSARDYKAAIQLSENLRSLALKGLHYFQTFEDSLRLSLLFLLL